MQTLVGEAREGPATKERERSRTPSAAARAGDREPVGAPSRPSSLLCPPGAPSSAAAAHLAAGLPTGPSFPRAQLTRRGGRSRAQLTRRGSVLQAPGV